MNETINSIVPVKDVTVTATGPAEMQQSQSAMVLWASQKLAELHQDRNELQAAYDNAIKHKWAASAIKRQLVKTDKRIEFHAKVFEALQNGYMIVPNFPVTAFAIRTGRKKPLEMWTNQHFKSHTQKAKGLPTGEGTYKNPFPVVWQDTLQAATGTTPESKAYWAESWKDLEFPVTMAKVNIIEATSRAMALKIFDDIGIMPGYAPSEGTRPPKGDPIIVGRVIDRSRSTVYSTHYLSFIIAWHINTRDI